MLNSGEVRHGSRNTGRLEGRWESHCSVLIERSRIPSSRKRTIATLQFEKSLRGGLPSDESRSRMTVSAFLDHHLTNDARSRKWSRGDCFAIPSTFYSALSLQRPGQVRNTAARNVAGTFHGQDRDRARSTVWLFDHGTRGSPLLPELRVSKR